MFDQQKFRSVMISAGFPTQRAFGEAVGRHESDVSRVIHGKKVLSLEERRRWTAFLGVDVEELMTAR